MATHRELLQKARKLLENQSIADAGLDAWYLLAHVLGINRTDYLLHGDDEVSKADCRRYMDLVRKRADHIPIQHLTGTQEFMGLEFEVTKDVLIPRQDTECLVEEVLKVCNKQSVLDLCTGSGCIIISLAKLGNLKEAAASDISANALEIAARNTKRHNVDIKLIQSNLFEGIEGTYDIIVSNPPYIPTDEIRNLMPEVRDHEPFEALDGSSDGLFFYREIVGSLNTHLKQGGYVFFEIGYDQGSSVKDLLAKKGFTDVEVKKDLSGHDRIVLGKLC